MPIGHLNEELGLVSADTIQHDGCHAVVKTVTFGHTPEDWEFQFEHGSVGEVLGAIAVDDNHVGL